jgi:hypothetical protein
MVKSGRLGIPGHALRINETRDAYRIWGKGWRYETCWGTMAWKIERKI